MSQSGNGCVSTVDGRSTPKRQCRGLGIGAFFGGLMWHIEQQRSLWSIFGRGFGVFGVYRALDLSALSSLYFYGRLEMSIPSIS